MFSKSILVSLLTLAISVQSISAEVLPRAGKSTLQTKAAAAVQCSTTNTVVRTVTVTARGAVATTSKAAAAITAKASATTTAKGAAATTTTKAAGNATGGNATGGNATGGNAAGNSQTALTLDPKVIATGFANNGQDVPTAGQVASLTSTNNFINFCLTVPNLPITNGQQITTGSCNPAPIGVIPSVDNMPSSKFTFPQNFGTIKAGVTFDVEMAIQKMQTGFFVNAQANYFSAPQQLNTQGQIVGHSHVVIEALTSLTQTTPTDPKVFKFFKGLNAAAVNGKLTATVTGGLTPGFYKLSSINSSSNHQPVIVPIAQHGSLDDAIYFTVTTDGKALAATAATGAKNSAAETSAVATTSVKAAAKPTATTSAASKKVRRASRRALNRQAQA